MPKKNLAITDDETRLGFLETDDDKKIGLTIDKNNLFGHQFPVMQIFYWISLVIFGSNGLRASNRSMEISAKILGINLSIPSWHTGRLWLMRLGYYKLNRSKTIADDWIWIIDHSVQVGSEKCLLILGIRLSDLPIGRALQYGDVEPIELIPVTKSNGDIVYEQLNATIKKTGVPTEIIADGGSDIRSGINRFISENTETRYIYDIKHALAILLKKELENNEDWKKYISLCRETKQRVQQTELAPLSPPNQKSKARYMNIDTLVDWGNGILTLLNKSDEEISEQFDVKKVKEKLDWVNDYRSKIEEWINIINIVTYTENFVRNNGIYADANVDLEKKLTELNLRERENIFKTKAVDFVRAESLKAKPGERLLGSSEIIESLFGKQKQIEKQQSKNGFTGLLLSLAAVVSKTTVDVVQDAMKSTKTKAINTWQTINIGKSVQAKRIKALNSKRNKEQKVSQDFINL